MAEQDPGRTIRDSEDIMAAVRPTVHCHRQACRRAPVSHYNSSTLQHYCARCARKINHYNPGICVPVAELKAEPNNAQHRESGDQDRGPGHPGLRLGG